MRKRIFEIIEVADKDDVWSRVYDYFMIVAITCSIIPLAFKQDTSFFTAMDRVCVGIFMVDYLLRLLTADYKYGKRELGSFLKYPFSFMALVDLVSILPSLTIINSSLKLLRVLRMIRAFRVFRVFKVMRYSRSFMIIRDVLKTSKESLIAVCVLAAGYVLISALVIFNVEPDSFNCFFDAVYWATVSLTTVGYGDIYTVSTIGRAVTMASSVFGIAIVALPAGIITAGYMTELKKVEEEEKEEK